jgi:Protein of unknown function (DUF2281)
MAQVEQQLMDAIRTLPPEQRQEVLDFAEFLLSKQKINIPQDSEGANPPPQFTSALELAGDLVGRLKGGSSDLSTNKEYLEGFGAV